MRTLLVISLCLTALSPAAEPPPLEPFAQGVFPRGLQRGKEVVMQVKGRHLQDLRAVILSGKGVTGEVLESSAYQAKLRIRAAADAEPGRRELRLLASQGSTLTWIDVSDRPETREVEPNNSREQANDLTFPALVNGTVPAADYDYFRFSAEAGQTLTFDLLATRSGSSFDGVLEILDADGRPLAFNDDYYAFKDPHLVHRFAKGGAYFLRIYGSGESGADTADYRLIAGAMPQVDLALPGGGRRGSVVEFDLQGVNLEQIRQVTLGAGRATGEVLSATATRARVRLKLPADMALGATALHVNGATLPVPFVVSDRQEMTVLSGAALRRSDPVPVPLDTVVNGVLATERSVDYFSFRLERPEQVVLTVDSMNLGFLLDPHLAVYDAAGKRIAWQDDPTTNTGKEPANLDPHLTLPVLPAGRYTVAVRDSQFRGDATFLYRLSVVRAVPDFEIRIVGAHTTLYRGKPNAVHVRVRRLQGWNTPVEVWAEGLPTGVSAPRMVAEPKNTSYKGTCGETHYLDGTDVEFPITVASDARLDLSKIVFRAKGTMNGRAVEHQALARYWKSRIRLLGDAEEPALLATVADLPGVVMQTPARAGVGRATVILTRLDDSAEPLVVKGEGVAPLTVPAGVTRADVEFGRPGRVVLTGTVGGRVIGQSDPVQVEARK